MRYGVPITVVQLLIGAAYVFGMVTLMR